MHRTMARPADVHDWLVAHEPLPVVALIDPAVDSLGFDARSAYVETYWLAVLGPSCVLAGRRLVAWLEAEPAGFEIPSSRWRARSGSAAAPAAMRRSYAR
jgi:hypothetical protein